MQFYLFSHMTLSSGRGWGVVRIYPGRCHWAELICPFQGVLFNISNPLLAAANV